MTGYQRQFPLFSPQILDTLLTFLTPKKEGILSGWRSASISETVKNLRNGQISLLDALRTFRESTTNKVSISHYRLTLFLLCRLITFILKCYSLFRVNFIYSIVVFHEIRVNLSRVYFQYFKFMEH